VLGDTAYGATLSKYNIVLGRPTNNSIAISVIAGTSLNVYVEYGYKATSLTKKTSATSLTALTPKVFEISGLNANSQVFYRIRSKTSDSATYEAGKVLSFSTQRKAGATFSFVVQGDSHPERAGKMFNADLYVQTLNNIASQKPDFMIMLGDDFSESIRT